MEGGKGLKRTKRILKAVGGNDQAANFPFSKENGIHMVSPRQAAAPTLSMHQQFRDFDFQFPISADYRC